MGSSNSVSENTRCNGGFNFDSGFNREAPTIHKKPKATTRFLGGKFSTHKKPVSSRYNSGFNYDADAHKKPLKPKTRFLGGKFSKHKKPVSSRYNSGFNHGGSYQLDDLVLEASLKNKNY